MRRYVKLFCCLLLVMTAATAQIGGGNNDPYAKIESQADAEKVFAEVKAGLLATYGFTLQRPLQMHLVHESEMDALFKDSPYKGAEVGLYLMRDGVHQIYVMKGWNRDYCSGVMAHEYTHAWQVENCPPGQEIVLKEGLAMWIEYKWYDSKGAYTYSDRVKQTADPVYGVGIKTMLKWEDKLGVKGLLDAVKRVRNRSEVPE